MLDIGKRILRFLNAKDGDLSKRVIRSGVWVSFSAATFNLLGLLRSVILARLLLPEHFGVISTCWIFLRFLEMFTQPGFHAAMVHSRKDLEQVKDTAFTLLVLRGIILTVIVALLAPFVGDFYENSDVGQVLFYFSVLLTIRSFKSVEVASSTKEFDFKRIALWEQASALLKFVLVVGLAYLMRNLWALVLGHILGSIIEIGMSHLIFPRRIKFEINKEAALELLHFGKFITGAFIVTFLVSQADVAVVGKLYGMEALGYYTIAITLALLPGSNLSIIADKIMLPAFSEAQMEHEKTRQIYLQTLRVVAALAIPAGVGLFVVASPLVYVLYGNKWLPSVPILKVLWILGVSSTLAAVAPPLFNGIGHPRATFYCSMTRLLGLLLVIYPLVVWKGIMGLVWGIVGASLLELAAMFFLLRSLVGLNPCAPLTVMLVPIAASAVMGAAVYSLRFLIDVQSGIGLAVSILTGVAVYAICLYLLWRRNFISILNMLRYGF